MRRPGELAFWTGTGRSPKPSGTGRSSWSSPLVWIEGLSAARSVLGQGFIREGGKRIARVCKTSVPDGLRLNFRTDGGGELILLGLWELFGRPESVFKRFGHRTSQPMSLSPVLTDPATLSALRPAFSMA